MTASTFAILVGIGLLAGILSGFVGIGGGVIIVPALVFLLGLSQHDAQGTSLALMLPPIGILAVMNYYKSGNLNITYAIIVAATFIIGGYFGSKLSLKLEPALVKRVFGIIMLLVSLKIIFTK